MFCLCNHWCALPPMACLDALGAAGVVAKLCTGALDRQSNSCMIHCFLTVKLLKLRTGLTTLIGVEGIERMRCIMSDVACPHPPNIMDFPKGPVHTVHCIRSPLSCQQENNIYAMSINNGWFSICFKLVDLENLQQKALQRRRRKRGKPPQAAGLRRLRPFDTEGYPKARPSEGPAEAQVQEDVHAPIDLLTAIA